MQVEISSMLFATHDGSGRLNRGLNTGDWMLKGVGSGISMLNYD